MAGRKKTETVEAEVVETTEVVPAGKMEFRLINPTEDGFLRRIQWNKEELEAAVRAKIASYRNLSTGRRTGRLHSPGRTPAGEDNGRQNSRPAA